MRSARYSGSTARRRMRWLIGTWRCGHGRLCRCCARPISTAIPAPWIAHDSLLATVLSFINCEKYPPSLLYLAMTLGPALMLLAAFERARGRLADWITTFGRVPFFYYVAHLFLLHALAVLFAWGTSATGWLFGPLPRQARRIRARPGRHLCGLAGGGDRLYPLCRWFAALKRRQRRMVVELSVGFRMHMVFFGKRKHRNPRSSPGSRLFPDNLLSVSRRELARQFARDRAVIDLLHVVEAGEDHRGVELAAEDIDRAARRRPVRPRRGRRANGAADHAGIGAERERAEDVLAGADAADRSASPSARRSRRRPSAAPRWSRARRRAGARRGSTPPCRRRRFSAPRAHPRDRGCLSARACRGQIERIHSTSFQLTVRSNWLLRPFGERDAAEAGQVAVDVREGPALAVEDAPRPGRAPQHVEHGSAR